MILRRFVLLLLLGCVAFATGCAAEGEDEGTESDEAEINRFFDGPVVRQLINLQNNVDSASGAISEDKSRLAKEMSTFGPALTKAQQTAYVNAYNKLERVKNNEKDYLEACRALRDFMQSAEGGGALKVAAPKTKSAAEAIFEGHKKLASTPYALKSAGFAAWVLDKRNAALPVVKAVAGFDWTNEVLTPALTHGAGQAVAEADGDTEAALAKLTEQLSPLLYATQDHMEVYMGWTALVTTIRSRDMKAFQTLEKRLMKMPVVGAFMSVGVLFNVLAGSADVQNGEISQETLATFGDAAQQLSRTLVSLADAGRLGRFASTTSVFTKFIQRITPGLGVLCTTAALREHIEKMGSDGAIGAYIGALGDVIALTGVLAESFGVTAPLGAIITGLGFTISFLGDFIQDWLAERAVQAEEKQLLKVVGLSDAIADVLVAVNAKHFQAWASDLKYDATKLQWIAARAPSMLTAGWLSGFSVDGFKKLVADLRYTDGGFALLQSIPDAVTETDGMNGPYDFVRDIGSWSFSGSDLRGQWIRAAQAQTQLGPQNHVRVFTNAGTYLSSH